MKYNGSVGRDVVVVVAFSTKMHTFGWHCALRASILYCSQKVGDIWTLKIAALTIDATFSIGPSLYSVTKWSVSVAGTKCWFS